MSQIWTPTGMVETERQQQTLPVEFMRMIVVFADCAGQISWGLHCSRCNQNISGHNAREDNRWHMECGCRTYTGANVLPQTERQVQ